MRRASMVLGSLLMIGLVSQAPVVAGGAQDDRVLEISVESGSPCPSLLGCDQWVRLLRADGSAEDAGSLDGTDGAGRASTSIQVDPGPVTVELTAGSVTASVRDWDLIDSRVRELTRCSIDLVVAEDAGAIDLNAAIAYGRPAQDPPATWPSSGASWSCEIRRSEDGMAPADVDPAPVVLDQAIVCEAEGPSPGAECGRAILAARSLRRAFEVAPIALATADCPDIASCAYPTFAVSFLTREGDAWPWSETLSVSLGDGAPLVTPWSEGAPSTRHAQVQQTMADRGDRLGAALPIDTQAPPPEGQLEVCATAQLPGTVVRDDASGVALIAEEGLVRVRWPHGWTARLAPEGVVLVDEVGETVAREGQRVVLGGGETADGWTACGGIEPVTR